MARKVNHIVKIKKLLNIIDKAYCALESIVSSMDSSQPAKKEKKAKKVVKKAKKSAN